MIKTIKTNPLDSSLKNLIRPIPQWVTPNHLTILRMVFVLLLVYLFINNHFFGAFILFLLASLTDGLDGTLARQRNQVTKMGEFLDPIIDKIFIIILIILFAPRLPWWLVELVIATEIILSCFALTFYLKKWQTKVNIFGKLKMNSEVLAIILLFLNAILSTNFFNPVIILFFLLTIVFAILAGFRHLRERGGTMQKKLIIITLLTFLLTNSTLAQNINWNSSFLFDEIKILKDQEYQDIAGRLNEFNNKNSLELKIFTIEKNDFSSLDDYCNDLYKNNQPTKPDFLSLIYNQQKNNVFSCRGPQPDIAVSDNELSYILNDIVQPNVANNNLGFALKNAIQKIDQAVKTDIIPETKKTVNPNQPDWQHNKIAIYLLLLILLNWLAAWLGRTKQWWLGGLIGASLGMFIWWLSKVWIFIFILSIFGFIYDYLVSQQYKKYQTCEKGKFWCHSEFEDK